MMKLVCTLATLLASVSSLNIGADVVLPNAGSDYCVVAITGTISRQDAEQLRRLDCSGPVVMAVGGPGGDAYAAMDIGRWARSREAIVMVHWDASCFSSCALVYLGGASRINGGIIGFHRPYLTGAPLGEDAVRRSVDRMISDIRSYVAELGVTPEVASIIINTPPQNVRTFLREEIYTLVPQVDPTQQEVEVARLARLAGVSTEVMRERLEESERVCRDRRDNLAHRRCSGAINWGLSESEYVRRDELATTRCRQAALRDRGPEAEACISRVMQTGR